MADFKKRVGIWLDYKEAFIINLAEETGGQPSITHLISNIDTGVAKGGSRSNVPYGPQGGISERAVEERRRHEEKTYYEAILQTIHPSIDELFLFGPSTAKLGLKNTIEAIKHYHPQIVEVRTAGKLTKNQMVAETRKFFVEMMIE